MTKNELQKFLKGGFLNKDGSFLFKIKEEDITDEAFRINISYAILNNQVLSDFESILTFEQSTLPGVKITEKLRSDTRDRILKELVLRGVTQIIQLTKRLNK